MLFDVDGTLVDSLPMLVRGLGDAYEHFNGQRPADDDVRPLIGLSLREQMKLFRPVPPSSSELDAMCRFAIERFQQYRSMVVEFELAVQSLRLFHEAGVPTALVTSKSEPELQAFLNAFSGSSWVTATVCSSDVAEPKPAPDSAFLACERVGADPARSILVGDSVFDLRCARAAGVRCAAVGYGAGSAEALLAESPDVYLQSPRDLMDWTTQTIYQLPCLERSP